MLESKFPHNKLNIHMYHILFIVLQSSTRETEEHLHCWRPPGMLSHTEDFNLDYNGKCRCLVQLCMWLDSAEALHEQTHPKRITSLIHWSIHMTRTVQRRRQVTQRTCHSDSEQHKYPSVDLCSVQV